MNKIHNWVNSGLIVLVALLVLVGNQSVFVGASGDINTVAVKFVKGLFVGDNSRYTPTKLTLVEKGTCDLLANFSITASTTRNVDCAIADARSGDVVILNLAASTTLASQYVIKSSQASSSSGYGTAQLLNLTGGTAVPAATYGFGSSTQYTLLRFE